MPSATEEKSEACLAEQSIGETTTCRLQTNDIVLRAMKEKLLQSPQKHRSEPFCVLDVGYVYKEYHRWTSLLPDVKPFYGRLI